ncbi:hypothetical protein EB796_014659 [Bugula neritina]|uniref:Guanylate-binding protein N-terminal domain-containing protein n=1 Tax=Bugula neritina TaxID=10212 RepID=A0A7J7JNM9_BUGNE|nr:hypothetical protein EB796_014659 [Bugula neritina]
MIKVADLPNGENVEVAEILVENYKSIFEGVDPELPLLSIAITGEMRTGKSFLLNLFLMYLEYIEQHEGSDEGWEESNQPIVGIDWAAGLKAVTQGIWMYNKPIIFTRKNKRKVAIVVIDIQGLGDSDNSDEAVDNLLMYVGLQMCNVQIINVNKKLNSFHFVKVASCATYSEMNDKVPSAFGTLLFLTRDFRLAEESLLGLQENYFSAMKSDAKHGSMVATFDRINKCFSKVICFNFPRPSDKVDHHEAKAGTLSLCGDSIGEDFLKYCKELFQYLLALPIKKEFNIDYSIKLFEGLKKRIAAHTDGLPNTEHVIVDVTINNIFIAAKMHFEELMVEPLDFLKFDTEEALWEILEKRCNSALDLFEKKCAFGLAHSPKFVATKK